jgi:hypothetical protein
MHGCAPGSGGPKGRPATATTRHGLYTAEAIASRWSLRQQIREVMALTRRLRELSALNMRRAAVRGTGIYGTDQCVPSSAWKLTSPESNDPVIAIVASTLRGKPILITEARKMAAVGRAMTK